jgi:hypothetical protein
VTADAFTGRGRLLVPMVGFPILWWQQHSWAALALWSVGTALAVALAFRHTDADRRRAQPARRRRVVDLFRTGHRGGATTSFFRGSGSATAGLSVGATTLVGCLLFSAAGASFSAETRNSGNGWSAASVLRSPYDTSVLSNTPTIYYRVDEPSGSTALDTSGAGRNGTYTAISAYAQTGAMVTNPDKSVCTTGGGGRLVSGGTTTSNPTTFSLEIWFKTTTTAGGKLIGFESTQASTSSKFDRHVYMNNTGRLVYGGWGSSPKTITTSAAYNNGTWHLLTLTAAPNGSTQRSSLYIDGVLSATGSTTAVTSYTGWWRAGYGALASGSGYPSSANFTGCLDNIAVYPSELSAAQVAAHYNAR